MSTLNLDSSRPNKLHTNKVEDIISIFTDIVDLHSDNIAIESNLQKISYKEMDHLSNQIAYNLKKAGIKNGMFVSTFMERTIDTFITWLGILKAGAAYLPIDPTNPIDRINYILEDSGTSAIVTNTQHLEKISGKNKCIFLISDLKKGNYTREEVKIQKNHEQLAYLIYTSGSTGKPKGVPVLHRGVVRLVKDTNYVELNENDRIAQLSNASFDAITFEAWGALLTGATLVIAEQEVVLSPDNLALWIEKQRITTIFVTTALFNNIAEVKPQAFYNLRYLLFGGEACNPYWIREVLNKGKPLNLLHVYGPTENTTFTLSYRIDELTDLGSKTVPIGKAIKGTQVYVYNEDTGFVEGEGIGELYIGGKGLALGYWKRDELTAEKFIDNPFDTQIGSKLYKSGDIVKVRNDGEIEFVGRTDHQVKLRGYRIELGEIEECFRRIDKVKECIVMLSTLENGDKRIISYYTTEIPLKKSYIRELLQRELPHYMLPSVFIHVDAFELNMNGKIDRRKLKDPDASDLNDEDHIYIAPSNLMEKTIAEVWCEVLKINQVSIYDNFFEIGGHSLLATQVVTRLRKKVGKNIPIQIIFEYPSIFELSKEIEKTEYEKLRVIKKDKEEEHYPLSLMQKRLWFLNQLNPEDVSYNIPFAFSIEGHLDTDILEESINEIIKRHSVLRSLFKEENGQPLQYFKKMKRFKLDIIDYRDKEFTQSEILNGNKIWTLPFDLENGPLMRAKLIRLAGENILILVFHHIIFDGWSKNILLKEMDEIYNNIQNNVGKKLRNLPIQFHDFAKSQAEWEKEGFIDKQLDYWKDKLTTPLPILDIPSDFRRSLNYQSAASSAKIELSEELTSRLRKISSDEGTTMFMTLLSTFKVFLYRLSGQNDILVGTSIAGRNYEEIESLIGFFVNTLIIRTSINGEFSFKDFLRIVKAECLEAFANQDVPFEKIVEEIHPDRTLSNTPIIQTMFVYHNEESLANNTYKIGRNELIVENDFAKFDLTLSIEEKVEKTILEFQYRSDLFDKARIEKMLQNFEKLIESLMTNPTSPVCEVGILSEVERVTKLEKVFGEKPIYNSNIVSVIEEQAKKTPQKIAVEYNGKSITYYSLIMQSRKISKFLIQEKGVEKGTRIAIRDEKSIETLIFMLAILQSGACMVPIDINYPLKRQQYMIHLSEPKLLFTSSKYKEQSLEIFSGDIIVLEDIKDTKDINDDFLETISVDSNYDAYIVFTSGSSGNPKAILNTHYGVLNYFSFLDKEFDIAEQDNVLQLASLSVDGFLRDLIYPLTCGAKVIMVTDDEKKDLELMTRIARNTKATCLLSTVPSYLKILSKEQLEGEELNNSLRLIFTSGEILSNEIVSAVQSAFPSSKLVNLYGPTECTLTTTFNVIQGPLTKKYVIGKPIDNTFLLILDKNMQIVPDGIIGDIYIGGAGLTKGYVGNPELNKEVFLTCPILGNETLYKTGDVGNYLDNGDIELRGRSDRQIKIRGYRVELDEVERVLEAHPDIRSAIATCEPDKYKENIIISYIVTKQDCTLISKHIVSFLQEHCPDYMIPSQIHFIDSIPYTPNGKIDRKQLKNMVNQQREVEVEVEVEVEEPSKSGKYESSILSIWREVLNKERIGVNDNFFEIGGHSLLATQIISRIRKQIGVNIALAHLFKYPTIRQLSIELENGSRKIRKNLITSRARKSITNREGI